MFQRSSPVWRLLPALVVVLVVLSVPVYAWPQFNVAEPKLAEGSDTRTLVECWCVDVNTTVQCFRRDGRFVHDIVDPDCSLIRSCVVLWYSFSRGSPHHGVVVRTDIAVTVTTAQATSLRQLAISPRGAVVVFTRASSTMSLLFTVLAARLRFVFCIG